MNGLETARQIMADRPTPIVVVSASVEGDDLRISTNAIRAGGLTVVEKPVGANTTITNNSPSIFARNWRS